MRTTTEFFAVIHHSDRIIWMQFDEDQNLVGIDYTQGIDTISDFAKDNMESDKDLLKFVHDSLESEYADLNYINEIDEIIWEHVKKQEL